MRLAEHLSWWSPDIYDLKPELGLWSFQPLPSGYNSFVVTALAWIGRAMDWEIGAVMYRSCNPEQFCHYKKGAEEVVWFVHLLKLSPSVIANQFMDFSVWKPKNSSNGSTYLWLLLRPFPHLARVEKGGKSYSLLRYKSITLIWMRKDKLFSHL